MRLDALEANVVLGGCMRFIGRYSHDSHAAIQWKASTGSASVDGSSAKYERLNAGNEKRSLAKEL